MCGLFAAVTADRSRAQRHQQPSRSGIEQRDVTPEIGILWRG